MAELWTTTSQSEVGGAFGCRHSLCALVHTQGQQPRDGWLCGAAAPVVDGSPSPSKRDAKTPMATHHRKAILHVRLSWNRLVLLGRLRCKKKRKLGPTDCQSGSVHVTMTPPRHADKDCFTTEETVTISSSRITRQGHCRSGAAESSLVARNHQPTNRRRPQRTTGDTRTVAWWNLRANVTDDENERLTVQWRTCKGGRALAHTWR